MHLNIVIKKVIEKKLTNDGLWKRRYFLKKLFKEPIVFEKGDFYERTIFQDII